MRCWRRRAGARCRIGGDLRENGVMQTETPVPPPESDSASAIDTETTNDFSGLILMITAILALGFSPAGDGRSSCSP